MSANDNSNTVPGTTITFSPGEAGTAVHCLRCAALSKRLAELEAANASMALELLRSSRETSQWRAVVKDLSAIIFGKVSATRKAVG